MATVSQKQFFRQLTEEKTFPDGHDTKKLLEEFDGLSTKSASLWIERALELPKLDEADMEIVKPTF